MYPVANKKVNIQIGIAFTIAVAILVATVHHACSGIPQLIETLAWLISGFFLCIIIFAGARPGERQDLLSMTLLALFLIPLSILWLFWQTLRVFFKLLYTIIQLVRNPEKLNSVLEIGKHLFPKKYREAEWDFAKDDMIQDYQEALPKLTSRAARVSLAIIFAFRTIALFLEGIRCCYINTPVYKFVRGFFSSPGN